MCVDDVESSESSGLQLGLFGPWIDRYGWTGTTTRFHTLMRPQPLTNLKIGSAAVRSACFFKSSKAKSQSHLQQ